MSKKYEFLTPADWKWLRDQAGGTDPDAIHDNVANEIQVITSKGTPVSADVLLIEDSAATWAKKSVTIGSLPAGSPSFGTPTGNIDIGDSAVEGTSGDATRADHQHAFTAPSTGYPLDVAESESDGTATTPARSDHIHAHGTGYLANAHHNQSHVLSGSDHTDSGLTVGYVIAADSATTFSWQEQEDPYAFHDNQLDEIHQITLKGTPVGADVLLIEDSAASWAKKYITITSLPFSSISGTQYTIPRFATTTTLGDSSMSEDSGGTLLTVTESIELSGDYNYSINKGTAVNAWLIFKEQDIEQSRFGWDTGDNEFTWQVGATPADVMTLDTSGNLDVGNNITLGGTIDAVDLAAFKTAYDAHDHSSADPTQVDYSDLLNVPSTFAPIVHAHAGIGNDGGTLTWDNALAGATDGDHDHSSNTEGSNIPESSVTFSTTGHHHTGVDSENVDYGDLDNVPSDFTPAAHVLATTGPHSGTLPLTDLAVGTQGSIIRRGAADWEEYALGTTNYVLKAGATDVAWGQVDYSELTGTFPGVTGSGTQYAIPRFATTGSLGDSIMTEDNTNDYITVAGGSSQIVMSLEGGTSVSLTTMTGYLHIGNDSVAHISMDTNSIQAKTDPTTATTLNLNAFGGNILTGSGLFTTGGNLKVIGNNILDSAGNVVISFDGSAEIDQIGSHTGISTNDYLKWDGSKWTYDAPAGGVSGSGTQYKIPRWATTSSLDDSIMTEDNTNDYITVAGGSTQIVMSLQGGTATALTTMTGFLHIGDDATAHLSMDTNTIQAKTDSTTAAALELNPLGGRVEVGDEASLDGSTLSNALVAYPQTTNAAGILMVAPDGTGTASYLRASNDSSLTQYGYAELNISGTSASLYASSVGGGTPPSTLNINNSTWDNINIGDASCVTTIGGNVDILGDLEVSGNDIKDSGSNTQITFTAGSLITFAYDIKIGGNDIKDSGDFTVLSFDGSGVIDSIATVSDTLNMISGADIALYSDAGITNVGTWDGATGNLQFDGTLTINDIVATRAAADILRLQPGGTNDLQLRMHPSSTEDATAVYITNDSDTANWASMALTVDGANAKIQYSTQGTPTTAITNLEIVGFTTFNMNNANVDNINLGDSSCNVGVGDLTVVASTISSASAIEVKPSGETDDYLTISAAGGVPYLNVIGSAGLYFTADHSQYTNFYVYEDGTHYGYLGFDKTNDHVELYSTAEIRVMAGNTTDYLEFLEDTNEAYIKRISGSDVHISSDDSGYAGVRVIGDAEAEYIAMRYNKPNNYGAIWSGSPIYIFASGDTGDYVRHQTTSSIPTIDFILAGATTGKLRMGTTDLFVFDSTGYLTAVPQQGTPSDNDVLAWNTSNSRWEVEAQVGGLTGSGTTGTLAKWDSDLEDSILKESGTTIELGGTEFIINSSSGDDLITFKGQDVNYNRIWSDISETDLVFDYYSSGWVEMLRLDSSAYDMKLFDGLTTSDNASTSIFMYSAGASTKYTQEISSNNTGSFRIDVYGDYFINLGDAAGSNSWYLQDSANNTVFQIDSDGFIKEYGDSVSYSDNDVIAWDSGSSKFTVQTFGGAGSGTAGTIAVWATGGVTLEDSILSESGTTLTIAGGTINSTAALTIKGGNSAGEDLNLDAYDRIYMRPTNQTTEYVTIYESAGNINVNPNADSNGYVGASTIHWLAMYADAFNTGDIYFENDFRIAEQRHPTLLDKRGFPLAIKKIYDGLKPALVFTNQHNEEIARLDEEGNLYLRGKVFTEALEGEIVPEPFDIDRGGYAE